MASNDDRSDEELLAELQDSEADASSFETLVHRHQERVLANCRYMTGAPAEAEDLAQEVFVKAYFALPRFERRSSFRTWIQKIKVNHCLNFLEKKKGKTFASLDEPGLEASPQLQVPAGAERRLVLSGYRERIGAILDSMADTLRLPLLMRDLDGLAYEEIADQLTIGLSAVKMRIKRAREEFRRRWDEQELPRAVSSPAPATASSDAGGGSAGGRL